MCQLKVNDYCKSEVYIPGFCDVSAESQAKKIPTERSGWGVLGVSLAEELKGEGRKNRRSGRMHLLEWEVYLSLWIQLFFYMLNFECGFYSITNHVLGYL